MVCVNIVHVRAPSQEEVMHLYGQDGELRLGEESSGVGEAVTVLDEKRSGRPDGLVFGRVGSVGEAESPSAHPAGDA
jgi:hypothetical protein